MIKKLNDYFNAQIPPDYRLVEKPHNNKHGNIWKPKFKNQPPDKYSHSTKEQILKKLYEVYKKKQISQKSNPTHRNDANQEIIHELVAAAKEKGASNDELTDIINMGHKNKEVYNPIKEGGHITNKP